MRCIRRLTFIVSVAGCLNLSTLLGSLAQAELYLGGQLGVAFPLAFKNIEGMGAASVANNTAIKLNQSLLYGAKAGYFLPSTLNWLGVELDAYHSLPHLKQQTLTVRGTDLVEGVHLGVTTLGMRVVIRSPGRNPEDADERFQPDAGLWQRFEPYVGLGPALFVTNASTGTGSSTDTKVGMSFQAGSRVFLTPRLALFAEYKLDGATLAFRNALAPGAGLKGDYTAHNIAFGLSFHFNE